MSLFFIDIEVRYPNTEFISFGAFFIKYLPKPIIVNGRSKSIISIKIQKAIFCFHLQTSASARSRRGGKPESLFPPPQHFIVRFAGGVARFGKPEVVVFYSTRTFTGLITRFPPPATVYHLPFSSLIFSDTPDVIYPTTYFSPVSISVKTTSVSQSPLTFTVPNSGCICSDLIMPSSFTSTKVCFF